jgi:hypothetical protein
MRALATARRCVGYARHAAALAAVAFWVIANQPGEEPPMPAKTLRAWLRFALSTLAAVAFGSQPQ